MMLASTIAPVLSSKPWWASTVLIVSKMRGASCCFSSRWRKRNMVSTANGGRPPRACRGVSACGCMSATSSLHGTTHTIFSRNISLHVFLGSGSKSKVLWFIGTFIAHTESITRRHCEFADFPQDNGCVLLITNVDYVLFVALQRLPSIPDSDFNASISTFNASYSSTLCFRKRLVSATFSAMP